MASALPPNPVPACPAGTVWLESQSWWSDAREPFPGAHIHLSTCFPLLKVVSGTVTLNIHGILHNDPGKVTFLRAQVFSSSGNVSGNIVQNIPGGWSCPGTAECHRDFTIQIPTNGLAAGRREVRLTLNIPNTPIGNRQYETTRWHMCIRSCTGSGAPQIDRMGAASWYTKSDYANVSINASDGMRLAFGGPISGQHTIRVRGEKPLLEVAVDARAHGMDPGLVLFDGAGNNAWRTVSIDTTQLENGQHRLFVRTDHSITNPTGMNSGVFVLAFSVSN